MSLKIAPAPPPLAPSLPRIAFLPNSQPVLLIPNSYTGKFSVPVRVSPNNDRRIQTVQFVQPKMPIQSTTIAMRNEDDSTRMGMREESGIGDYLPSTQQRREFLKRKIQERPSKQYLIRKHILLTDPLVEPFVGEKTHQLRKQAVVSNLNRKLKTRPGPLDLVTKKILQADAELEEAIKEGRLLFPSSRRELESPSPSTPQAPSPSVLLSTLRISKKQEKEREETIREEEEARAAQEYSSYPDQGMMDGGDDPDDHNRARKYGRVETRAQALPYARLDPQQPSPSKGRLKGPETKNPSEYTVPDNFEAMMKQQELLIEWRTRPDIDIHHQGAPHHSQQHLHEDGVDSDSGETIPYGDEAENNGPAAKTTITYRVFPEHAAASPEQQPPSRTMIHPSKNALRAGNPPQFKGPIFSLADIKKTDLMQECRERGLKCGGDKTTIMSRLEGVKEEIIDKFKEVQSRLESQSQMENSPQMSSERALSNTSSSSSPSTIIDESNFDGNGMTTIDESIATRRHSLPSNNPHQGIARSLQPPTRHLSMSSGSHPPVSSTPTAISSLSFSPAPNAQNGQMERKIQMKTANGEIFYATLPSADDLPIPRDGKPIGCKIAIINGKPVLQFQQQPSGPIEPGSVGPAGIRDTLLFAQNGSGGQVTLGPQKERSRSNSLNRKFAPSGEVNSFSSLLRSNSSTTTLPVMVQRTARTQSTSSSSSSQSRPVQKREAPLPLPRDPSRKPSRSPPQPPREPSVQPQSVQPLEAATEIPAPTTPAAPTPEPAPRELTDAEQVFAHVRAINKLLDRPDKITLDAKTVLEHEQALRHQQRLIDQMQKELKKSYTALKIQQQLILSAKRAQSVEIAKMTNNKIKNIGEAWLFELNMKRLHKSNSNFFLTHEQQTIELANMTEEHKKVLKQHAAIQVNEASDSAIKDLTKFIGASPKTALLIVQLLKKYQNEKNQSTTQPTFADIPAFEASEKTPTSARPQSIPSTSSGTFTLLSQPGPSRMEKSVHDHNGNDSTEAIVIDDDSQDEEPQSQPQSRLKLSAPPVRNRRKEQRGTAITVDMEAIFRTVLDGSKTGNQPVQPVQQQIGSPAESNMNKTIDHSPSHSVSSIPSSSSLAGIHPSTSSSSPCSSSTPPEMHVRHQMHYGNHNIYPSHSGEVSMEYMNTLPPFESIQSRPYVRDGLGADDNPTDILMEAVESSGIVDDGGDEMMPSSSQSMHMMPHDQLQIYHDDNIDHYSQHQDDSNQLTPPEDNMLEHIIAGNFEFTGFDAFENLVEKEEELDDVLEYLKTESLESKSPEPRKVDKGRKYNGTEELNKVLGPDWQDANSHGHQQMHPMQLDVPTSSLHGAYQLDDQSSLHEPFQDVFAASSSSHVGSSRRRSTSSLLSLPNSPLMFPDMSSWYNGAVLHDALSAEPPFIFEPNNA